MRLRENAISTDFAQMFIKKSFLNILVQIVVNCFIQ